MRTQCQNNLKQIALAVHGFAGANGQKMPALTNTSSQAGVYGGYQGGILLTLLPFLEQLQLYGDGIRTPGDTWDSATSNGATPPTGPAVRTIPIKVYQCPADPTMVSNGYPINQVNSWAGSSYGANFPLFGAVRGGGNSDVPQYNLGNIPDGASQTIAFSDVYATATFNGGGGSLWAYPGIDWSWAWHPVIANTRTWGANGNPSTYPPATSAWGGAYQLPQNMPPTAALADKSRAQSGHPRTTLVALADGSSRSLDPTSISQTTWQAVLLPDDNVAPGTDW